MNHAGFAPRVQPFGLQQTPFLSYEALQSFKKYQMFLTVLSIFLITVLAGTNSRYAIFGDHFLNSHDLYVDQVVIF